MGMETISLDCKGRDKTLIGKKLLEGRGWDWNGFDGKRTYSKGLLLRNGLVYKDWIGKDLIGKD